MDWKLRQARPDGAPTEIELVSPESASITLDEIIQILSEYNLEAIPPSTVQQARRVVLWKPGWIPGYATVQRQRGGRIYAKPEKGYGISLSEKELENSIFPLDSFFVIAIRWIYLVKNEPLPKQFFSEE